MTNNEISVAEASKVYSRCTAFFRTVAKLKLVRQVRLNPISFDRDELALWFKQLDKTTLHIISRAYHNQYPIDAPAKKRGKKKTAVGSKSKPGRKPGSGYLYQNSTKREGKLIPISTANEIGKKEALV